MTPRILALALSAALSGALPAISYAAPVTASFEGLGFLPMAHRAMLPASAATAWLPLAMPLIVLGLRKRLVGPAAR